MASRKKSYDPDKTEGAKIAKENRREMNDFSDEKLDELNRAAMARIYGNGSVKVRPRH